MKLQGSKFGVIAFSLFVLIAGATSSFAQGRPTDPFAGLKRAISQAGAPALSATQEAALTTLLTDFRNAAPDAPDDALETAQDALQAAIIAGNLAGAQVQITIITTRTAQLQDARLQSQAKLGIGFIAVLKTGGQYDLLVAKYGIDRVLGLLGGGERGRFDDGPSGGRR